MIWDLSIKRDERGVNYHHRGVAGCSKTKVTTMKEISKEYQRNYVNIESIVLIYCSLERRVLSIDNEEIYYEKEYYEETE